MHERRFQKRREPSISGDVEVVPINAVDSGGQFVGYLGKFRTLQNSRMDLPREWAFPSPLGLENTRSSVLAITSVFGRKRRVLDVFRLIRTAASSPERSQPFTTKTFLVRARIIGRSQNK